jgi:hypothetical protein
VGVSYTTRQLVLGSGVPLGALVRPARDIDSVDDVANVLSLACHGLADGDAVELTVSADGVLPSGLQLLTIYYALLITLADGTTDENRFQLASAPGGEAIALIDAGTQPFSLLVPVGPVIDVVGEMYSRWVDQFLPGDAAPLTAPFPALVTQVVTIRTGNEVMTRLGRVPQPSAMTREQAAVADFLSWAKNGAPLRGDATGQTSTNTAVVRNAVGNYAHRGTIP